MNIVELDDVFLYNKTDRIKSKNVIIKRKAFFSINACDF